LVNGLQQSGLVQPDYRVVAARAIRLTSKKIRLGFHLEIDEAYSLEAVFKKLRIWNRIWVMQEAACAPKVTLVAGRSSLDWELVASFLGRDKYGPADVFHEPLGHRKSGFISDKETFKNPQVVAHQRRVMKEMSEGYASTLLDILSQFRFAKSTDPRDKVYGLLGLVSQPHGIIVDYNKKAQQIFTDTAEHLINCSGNLDILCQSRWQNIGNPDRMVDLPSGYQTSQPLEIRLFFSPNAQFSRLETIIATYPARYFRAGLCALTGSGSAILNHFRHLEMIL
jgi:hypothetical protein